MGRGRGKGKKLTAVTTHEHLGNESEEPLPTYKRRGRLQKLLKVPLMDGIDDDYNNAKNEEVTEDVKHSVSTKELKLSVAQNGKKRKKNSPVKESPDPVSDENDGLDTKVEEATRYNGFRHIGSRRKSKPCRAAET